MASAVDDDQTEADPSVCYRHPDRQSWILCQRCGRTICPECQILAPVGVQCPECVREAGGSVQWKPRGGGGSKPRSVAASMRRRPAWVQWISRFVRPDGDNPVVTYVVLGLSVLVFIVGLVTPVLGDQLVASPLAPGWQVWRFFTAMLVPASILNLLLSGVFFVLIAPTVERMMGRIPFLTVLLAGGAVGAASMLITGSGSLGLSGAMWGMFAAYFIYGRSMGASMRPFLIIMAFNLVFSLLFSPGLLPLLIGGMVGGAGAGYALLRNSSNARAKPVTPYWQIGAGVAVFIVVALLRTSIVF